jgi:hypothetical protein
MLTIGETLADINKDINELRKHAGNQYLRNVFECAFLPEKKFLLPEGVPPFKINGLSSVETKGTFWQEARKFYTYLRPDLKPIIRERNFIQALEALDKESVGIMLSIKEQTLTALYPNITFEALKEVGYFK